MSLSKPSYRFGWSQLVGLVLLGLVWSSLWSSSAAVASVHCYPEAADQVMWRSLQTLRDDADAAWQIVVYKRLQTDRTIALHLRLVGFPGVEVARSQGLQISAGSRQWTAKAIAAVPLPTSASEYDLKPVLAELRGSPPLELSLPLADRSRLIVPPFVVQEWQTVAQKSKINEMGCKAAAEY